MYEWGTLGVTHVHTIRRTNHTQACDKNTEKHAADLRSISQNTRETSRSSTFHHTDAETEDPKQLSLSSTSSLERPVTLVGHAMFATVVGDSVAVDGTSTAGHNTTYEVNKLARKATAWAKMPQVNAHQSPVVTYKDAGWTTRPDGTSQGRQQVFIANAELLQRSESNMSLISWHLSRLTRVAMSSSAAETQAAANGDDEAVWIRLCLKEVLFGHLDLKNWQSEARQLPAALLVDCHGVHDAWARSSSSCLGFKDKKSGVDALALKESLVERGKMISWCPFPHSWEML